MSNRAVNTYKKIKRVAIWYGGGGFFFARRAATRLSREKHIIFCFSNGRSGTTTLAAFFSCIAAVDSHHEPDPSFAKAMRKSQRLEPDLARSFLAFKKMPVIARSPKGIYVETSHLFGKGFFRTALDLGLFSSFVILRREARQIALSMYRLGTIPGRTPIGNTFYLNPGDPVFVPVPDWEEFTDYQLCYWHALETEVRQHHYGNEARRRGMLVADVNLSELNSVGGFERVATELNVSIAPGDQRRIDALRGQVLNPKLDLSINSLAPSSLAEQEAEVLSRAAEFLTPSPDSSGFPA